MGRTDPPWEKKRELKVKAEDTTDPEHGYYPNERPATECIRHGVINLDKPAGPTSHETAAWVKRIMHLNRIGHGGTLEA